MIDFILLLRPRFCSVVYVLYTIIREYDELHCESKKGECH